MTTKEIMELVADLRSRINPAYANQRGTESYERRLCAEAIEELVAERDALKAELATEKDIADGLDKLARANYTKMLAAKAKMSELASQEPVAWMWMSNKGWLEYSNTPHDTRASTPLYAAPQGVNSTHTSESPRKPCDRHPDAPHGFDRTASHNADRYVCQCASWTQAS